MVIGFCEYTFFVLELTFQIYGIVDSAYFQTSQSYKLFDSKRVFSKVKIDFSVPEFVKQEQRPSTKAKGRKEINGSLLSILFNIPK